MYHIIKGRKITVYIIYLCWVFHGAADFPVFLLSPRLEVVGREGGTAATVVALFWCALSSPCWTTNQLDRLCCFPVDVDQLDQRCARSYVRPSIDYSVDACEMDAPAFFVFGSMRCEGSAHSGCSTFPRCTPMTLDIFFKMF